jgi:crotonobetainyl-CoA:carnitine CoA-transferase CaiB-like acyl-CoA transferase
MCRAYGLEQIAEDPRFATLEARMNNRLAFAEEVRTQVAEAARHLSLDEVTKRFRKEDVPFAYSRALDELFEDEQIVHNKMFRIVDHPVAGKLREARAAALFRGTPVAVSDPAPTIGQHTREILTEAGYADRIDDLLERGVVSN